VKRVRICFVVLALVLAGCQGIPAEDAVPVEEAVLAVEVEPVPEVEAESAPELEDVPAPEPEIALAGEYEPEPDPEPESIAPAQAPVPDERLRLPPVAQIEAFYTLNPGEFTYVGIQHHPLNFFYPHMPYLSENFTVARIINGLAAFEGLVPTDGDTRIASHQFLLWTTDGVRHVYGIGRDGHLIADGSAYILPEGNRQVLEDLHTFMLDSQSGYQDGWFMVSDISAHSQWLAWMTQSRITEIIYHSPTRGALSIRPALFEFAIFQINRNIWPTGNAQFRPGEVDFSGNDVFHVEIRFTGGIVYNIHAVNDGYGAYYYVQSSDMPFGIRHRLLIKSIDGAASHLIEEFERIADAVTVADVTAPNLIPTFLDGGTAADWGSLLADRHPEIYAGMFYRGGVYVIRAVDLNELNRVIQADEVLARTYANIQEPMEFERAPYSLHELISAQEAIMDVLAGAVDGQLLTMIDERESSIAVHARGLSPVVQSTAIQAASRAVYGQRTGQTGRVFTNITFVDGEVDIR